MHQSFAGLGNLSPTLNKSRILTLSEGQWLGEELSFAGMPVIYDAVVSTEIARVVRISV